MRQLREQIPRNDSVDRTRTAILRPATAGRAEIRRFGHSNCRTCRSEPGFSLCPPNTQAGRRNPAPWPDSSGMRCFRDSARQTLESRRFYLIAVRNYGSQREWVAVPVTGECELINAEMMSAGESDAPHVAGWLSHDGDVIEVLNLDVLTPGPEQALAERATPQGVEVRP